MQWFKQTKNKLSGEVNELVNEVDRTMETVVNKTDSLIDPVRRSAFRKFPTFFLLLVTFGAATVVYSFERLISQWTYVNDRPWLILLIGISALALTGQLYKKLDK